MRQKKVLLLNNKGQKLVGHYYKNISDMLLIYCHGLESFGNYPKMEPFFKAYYNLGFSLFWFDFTGYGESEGTGKFNYSQRVDDIGTVLQYFKEKYKKIILAGISLGSIPCAIAATKYKEITKLFLVNGYYALRFTYPKFILLQILDLLISWETKRELIYGWRNLRPEKIKIPTLVVVGNKDNIVNPKQSFYFYNKLQTQKKLIVIPDGDHALLNKKYINLYLDQIGTWLKE